MSANSSNAETFYRWRSWFWWFVLMTFIVFSRHTPPVGTPGNLWGTFYFFKSCFGVFCQHTMQVSKIVMWFKFSNKGVCTSHPSEIIRLFFILSDIFQFHFPAHNRILGQSLYNNVAAYSFIERVGQANQNLSDRECLFLASPNTSFELGDWRMLYFW